MANSEVTALLLRAHNGESAAVGEVYELLHRELAQIARARLREGGQNTLNTVALINESYLRLCDGDGAPAQSRAHFLALSSRAMRHILIDYFRQRTAEKRGGFAPVVTLNEQVQPADQKAESLLALDDALELLAKQDERLARVVECRFFGGMSYEEIGQSLGLAARTVRADWRKAKAWLTLALEQPRADP